MKKTQTINPGGIIFHINVDAYGQLYAYLTSVKNQFTDMAGQDDIIADIDQALRA